MHARRLNRFSWFGVCVVFGGWLLGAASMAAAPAAPTALIAITGDRSVTLRWDPVPGATSYTVRRRSSASSGSYSTVQSGVTATTYTHEHTPGGSGVQVVNNGTTYYYIVTATDGSGTSPNSNQARATPLAPLPPDTVVQWPLSRSTEPDGDVIRYAFGPRNIGRYDFHGGLDLNAAQGTPIYAAMAGTIRNIVTWDGTSTGGGNNVLVSHGDHRWTAYLHMHSFADGIAVGMEVSAGTLLGYVGKSGATSNHLHFTYMVGLSEPTPPSLPTNNESRSRSPLELLPYTPTTDATASFREDGSNIVDVTIPAQANTIRWIILRGGGETRLLDYYDVVAQGSSARDTQEQYGLVLNVAAPTIPYPGGGGTVHLWVKPDPAAPGGVFRPERITVLDFNGDTLVDRTAYQAWKLARGLALDAADDSDDDADGLPLLVEYALALDPNAGSWSGAPELSSTEERLELTYRRARPELNYVVEASDDLVNWSSAGVAQEFAVDGENVTAATPLGANGRKFLRLAVSR